MEHNKKLGKIGEDIAAGYLSKKGFKILERNWRHLHKEIDIIAKEHNQLVIVEVKTRVGHYDFHPGDLIPISKQHFLIDAADAYIRQHNIETETRFDVIFVFFPGEGQHDVQHIERAFYPTL